MTPDGEDERPIRANPQYALGQIARALATIGTNEDPETRQRARDKVHKWMSVLEGMLHGTLHVGSRMPIVDMPTWVTPEVMTGGFVTGQLMAGGPLRTHENQLLKRLSIEAEKDPRRLLNGYYLTDDGRAELTEMLNSQKYLVSVPEEAALLVAEWLALNGKNGDAQAVLEQISPFFAQLRFFPAPAARTPPVGGRVFLQDAGSTVASLGKVKPNRRFLAQKEAIELWAPLYAETTALFLETIEGDPPSFQHAPGTAEGRARRRRNDIVGGWPCKRYPDGWKDRASEFLVRYGRARANNKLSGKPERGKENFAKLRKYLQQCIETPGSLSPHEIGMIRVILARYVAKWGLPNSPPWVERRAAQLQQVKDPPFHQLAALVAERLARYPQDRGIEDLTRIVQPVTRAEADRSDTRLGATIPQSILRKVARCKADTAEGLVKDGLVTSGEALARVLPPIIAELRAAGIPDPSLRQVYASVYQAFRRRRSLLLLNLEHQARLDELPWVAPIEELRSHGGSGVESARQALNHVAGLGLTSFPHALLPNKLIQELQALASDARVDLPLTEELAADIFMGQFSAKYTRAAKQAANLLKGTLYQTYYGIDYQVVQQLREPESPRRSDWRFPRQPDPLAVLCASRAGVSLGQWKPALNGMIIEQQQIITTHNLAVLFDGLSLSEQLKDRLPELAEKCFVWICKRAQVKTPPGHATLIMLKHTAYAWRQMVFYLSFLEAARAAAFVSWAEDHLQKQGAGFRVRFRPALIGLRLAIDGKTLDDPHSAALGARRFLGWTVQRHWVLGDQPPGLLRRLFKRDEN